jgi:23S rRNA pseudouridine1911/1915/1917 synthase
MEGVAAWILHEDRHIVVVNKPGGLATQAPAGIPSVEGEVKEYLRQKYNKPGGVYLGVPQRLDRPVSGVLVLARQTKAAQRLHEQFQQRTVEKEYWAVVSGRVEPAEGSWQDWLRKVPEAARVERSQPGDTGSKWAETRYRVLAWGEECTWLAFYPQTGRMHQLRAQTAWRGHPILGDALYGSTCRFGPEVADSRGRCIALHARRLTLRHPLHGEFGQRCTFIAPLPGYWDPLKELFPSLGEATTL